MKKYKLSICPAFEKDSSAYKDFKFDTKEEMIAAHNSCTDLLLFLQNDIKVMEDYSNSFDCMELIDEEWKPVEI